MSLHQRMNLLLLLFHHGEQGDFLFAGVVSGDAVVLLFLLVDFFGDGKRINIHRDGEVQEAEIRETLDYAWIRCARPACEDDERVIVAVEEESKVALSAALAVPAIFLNRKFGSETVCRVVIETVVE